MRKVTCTACRKRYDFDKHEFCPHCGAFYPQTKQWDVDNYGNAVRVDGVSKPTPVKRRAGRKRKPLSGGAKAWLIVAAAVLLFVGLDFVTRIPKVGPIKDITSFSFKYSDEKDWESALYYTLRQKEDGGWWAAAYLDGWKNMDTNQEIQVDEQFKQRIEDLLIENHVRWWRGPYGSVLHGSGGLLGKSQYICDLSYSQADGTRKFTTAYMTKPINYEKVKNGVIEIYSELLE